MYADIQGELAHGCEWVCARGKTISAKQVIQGCVLPSFTPLGLNV